MAAVVIQKSIREGFGLTVTEALWKERPVVASNVGGIPIQIQDGENGFLLESDDTEGFKDDHGNMKPTWERSKYICMYILKKCVLNSPNDSNST